MTLEFSISFLLIAAFILLALNALFAAAEFAVLRCHPEQFEEQNGTTRRSNKSALWLLERLDVSLAASELGMTITSLSLGWITVRLSLILYGAVLPEPGLGEGGPHALYVVSALSALAVVALAHLVLGELVAKSIALRYSEATLRLLGGPLLLFAQVTRPIIFVANKLSNVVLKLFRTSVPNTADRIPSVSDLSRIVSQGTEQGVFDEDEESMLRGVFGFSETVAREVMTPRTDLIAVAVGASLTETLEIIGQTGFSRFPVKGNGIDDLHGILLAKDVLAFIAKEGPNAEANFHTSKMMRQAYFIPGTKPIDDLLNEFKKRKLHMAIVLDEHGGVDGLVTLEDLLEEIVGDIYDESDTAESDVVIADDGDVIVDGGMLVADLNERLELNILEGDYDTIAGFIFTSLGGMPEDGDTIVLHSSGRVETAPGSPEPAEEQASYNGTQFSNGSGRRAEDTEEGEDEDTPTLLIIVEKVQNHRIESVRLRSLLPPEEAETGSDLPASQN